MSRSRKAVIEISWEDEALTVSSDILHDYLNKIFRDWEDGRYPFCVEMVQRGLEDSIKFANEKAIIEEETKKHGKNCMIEVSPRSFTNKAIIEADKRYKETNVSGIQIKQIIVSDKD